MKLCAVIALLEKMIKLLNLIQSVFHSLCLIVTKLGTVVFPKIGDPYWFLVSGQRSCSNVLILNISTCITFSIYNDPFVLELQIFVQ